MSLFKYFTHIETDPNGPISTQMDKSVITEVNKQLRDVQQKTGNPKKRGAYSHRSATEKAAIGRYACENGVAATLRHFKRTKGITLKESSVRDWKKLYLSEVAAIRQSKLAQGSL